MTGPASPPTTADYAYHAAREAETGARSNSQRIKVLEDTVRELVEVVYQFDAILAELIEEKNERQGNYLG